jgi:hypothetical protein
MLEYPSAGRSPSPGDCNLLDGLGEYVLRELPATKGGSDERQQGHQVASLISHRPREDGRELILRLAAYWPMNVSWTDLNNVDQPGEYPFRDGTITVTFAEIAAWKKQPDVQFRLMRKHPIRGQIAYVLGEMRELPNMGLAP